MRATWIQENDRIAVALQSPLALGCAQAGHRRPRAEAEKKNTRDEGGGRERLDRELDGGPRRAYRAMEENSTSQRGLAARAAAIELAGRTTHAAVVAAAGAGNLMVAPAQRVYREALAFSVLALSPPSRTRRCGSCLTAGRAPAACPSGAFRRESAGSPGHRELLDFFEGHPLPRPPALPQEAVVGVQLDREVRVAVLDPS
jgi:hypothetical protein